MAASIASCSSATIQDAFEKLEAAVHPSDLRLLKSTTLEAVMEAAKIIERDQSQRRTLRSLRRIEPLFQALRKFGGAIETLCQGTPYLCFIWAPIKLLLQIADEYTKGFEELVDAYGQIAKHLPRLDRYASLFDDHSDFQAILANVYSDILDFHLHAYKIVRRQGWKHLFDASWRDFRGRLNAILQNLSKSRDLLDREANSFDALEAKEFRRRIYDNLEREESERHEWQLRNTIAWLDLKGHDREQEDLFERRAKAREAGTCEWILQRPVISHWLDEEDRRPFVWLRGKPGSGKTTLATYLKEHCPLAPSSTVLYCLCSYGFGKAESNACSLVLRSLIAQLVRKHVGLLPHVYNNFVKFSVVTSMARIREILSLLINSLEMTYLILDGLDECESAHQKQILAELTDLTLPGKTQEASSSLKMKVLVCSRETKDITRRLSRAPQVALGEESEHVSRDIATFTQRALSELYDRFDQAVVDELNHEIVKKADGMFLWVQLILDNLLEQESVRDLRAAARRLPSGLPGLYKNILDRLCSRQDEVQRCRARYILGWLTFAYRPLKTWELCDGLALYENNGPISAESKLSYGVLDLCKPLIEERESSTMSLVHFSAREFLLHRLSSDHGPYLSPALVHAESTLVALRYLLCNDHWSSSFISPKVCAEIILGFHDIFPYIHEFWIQHLQSFCKAVSDENKHDTSYQEIQMLLRKLSNTSFFVSTDLCKATQLPGLEDTAKKEVQLLPATIRALVTLSRDPLENNQPVADQDEPLRSEELPVGLSKAYRHFRDLFESVLDDGGPFSPEEMHVSLEDLRRFRVRHGASSYLCRWTGCPWASIGFSSSNERFRHEEVHKHRFRCSDSDCALYFASRRALRAHDLRYHTEHMDLVLPTFSPQSKRKQRPATSDGDQQGESAQNNVSWMDRFDPRNGSDPTEQRGLRSSPPVDGYSVVPPSNDTHHGIETDWYESSASGKARELSATKALEDGTVGGLRTELYADKFNQLMPVIQQRVNQHIFVFPPHLIKGTREAEEWLREARGRLGAALQRLAVAQSKKAELLQQSQQAQQISDTGRPRYSLSPQEMVVLESKIAPCKRAIAEAQTFMEQFKAQQNEFRDTRLSIDRGLDISM